MNILIFAIALIILAGLARGVYVLIREHRPIRLIEEGYQDETGYYSGQDPRGDRHRNGA